MRLRCRGSGRRVSSHVDLVAILSLGKPTYIVRISSKFAVGVRRTMTIDAIRNLTARSTSEHFHLQAMLKIFLAKFN